MIRTIKILFRWEKYMEKSFLRELFAQKLAHASYAIRDYTTHEATIGLGAEESFCSFFQQFTPKSIRVTSGFLFNETTQKNTKQSDILVYNQNYSVPILRINEKVEILSDKDVIALFEVKDQKNVTHALKPSFALFKQLSSRINIGLFGILLLQGGSTEALKRRINPLIELQESPSLIYSHRKTNEDQHEMQQDNGMYFCILNHLNNNYTLYTLEQHENLFLLLKVFIDYLYTLNTCSKSHLLHYEKESNIILNNSKHRIEIIQTNIEPPNNIKLKNICDAFDTKTLKEAFLEIKTDDLSNFTLENRTETVVLQDFAPTIASTIYLTCDYKNENKIRYALPFLKTQEGFKILSSTGEYQSDKWSNLRESSLFDYFYKLCDELNFPKSARVTRKEL